MKQMRTFSLVVLACLTTPSMAATDIGVAWPAVTTALKDASTRAGVELDFSDPPCRPTSESCRWSSGSGVEIVAESFGGPNVYRIDVGWGNSDKNSSSRSASLFLGLCGTLVAMVRPQWTHDQIDGLVRKIALLKPTKNPSTDAERAFPDVKFYGSRNEPDHPDFPAQAYVQCGVVGNTDNP